MSNIKLLIITPIFLGDGTGATVDYQLLVQNLQNKSFDFTIISEKTKEILNIDNCQYLDIFPTRSGKQKQIFKDILGYAWQNLLYLKLYLIIKKAKPNFIIVHSSFYNLPGIFPQIIKNLISKKISNQQYIADVRDVLLPAKQVKYLSEYNKVIACSENVISFLLKNGLPQQKIQYIPVPQEEISVNPNEVELLLSKLGLIKKSYIFYAGMIKEIKAIDLLLEAFTHFVRPILPEVILVIAGYIKTSNSKIIKLLQAENVNYVGNRKRQEVLQLMARASLCINISPNESISRSSLEALALKRPTLLPPNIPEYMHFCPDFVVTSRNPQEIAQQMIEILNSQTVPAYPIERHFPATVITEYEKLLEVSN